ncbi:MAG: SH3 domain-containing protein [Treponema sp.]|nr:SH3 domain-containing protein [Treponema sp.]
MKKLFCILFATTLLLASLFADKSKFYENGKVIGTMYVEPPEGLRVRSKPSLSADKVATLPYRVGVKILSVGPEETIDEITAPWIEILLPRYEWKGFEPEYGWVFGGYLAKKPAPFSTKNWNNETFRKFLTKNQWIQKRAKPACPPLIYVFKQNGEVSILYAEMGAGAFGTWNCNFKNRTVTTRSRFEFAGDDNNVSQEKVETLNVTGISDSSIFLNGEEYVSDCNYAVLANEENFRKMDGGDSVSYNSNIRGFMQGFYTSPELFYSVYSSKSTYYDEQFIRYGLSCPEDSAYMAKYADYWNPIMDEHQKKADAIK